MLISAFERVKVRRAPLIPVLLDKRLIIVTGKGGVGKTAVAAALALASARAGQRTLVCEVNARERISALSLLFRPSFSCSLGICRRDWGAVARAHLVAMFPHRRELP